MPQGKVLALVLFVIIISNIDREVKERILKYSAGDSGVNEMTRSEDEKKKIQNMFDIPVGYKWAETNLMQSDEEHLEQRNHGRINNISMLPYRGPAGENLASEANVKDPEVSINEIIEFKEDMIR